MFEEILVNVATREVRVALLENNIVQEFHVERYLNHGLVGNIYKGKIARIMPGIQAAFVDIGLDKSGFLHVKDVAQHVEDIRKVLHEGQEILVQVYKEQLGSKGPRLTTNMTIPSRYLVLTPNNNQITVSQKITNPSERERLLTMLTAEKVHGYIFRTAAEGAAIKEIEEDKVFLEQLWSDIQTTLKQSNKRQLVYQEIPLVLRVIRDLMGYEIDRIRVDDAHAVEEMIQFAQKYVPKMAEKIEFYADHRPLFEAYAIEEELQKALDRKVNLKSGGYVVLDQTEAMTTIDVNTGSYLGQNNLEQTVFKTNLQAAEEIARQMRLRNLGGIIIIDFIDMEDAEHKSQLLDSFKTFLAKDRAYTELSKVSKLGLIQMTRKRSRESLEHILCIPCPLCECRGYIKSKETITYEIIREIKRLNQMSIWSGFLILGSEEVIDCFLENANGILTGLKSQISKPIELKKESSYKQVQYDILPLPERTGS